MVLAYALALLLESGVPKEAALVVDTRGDVGAPCRAAGTLVDTLAKRLPSVQVVTDAALRAGDLGVSLQPEGGVWRLRVARPDGAVVMARDVRPGEPTCAALAETCVLILDRYLGAVAWRGRDPRLDPGSLRTPAAPRRDGPAPTSAGGRKIDRLTFAAGPALWTDIPTTAAPAVSVDVSARFRRLFAAVWAAARMRDARRVVIRDEDRGSLRTQGALFGGSLGGCGVLGWATFCGGGLAAALALWGSADGTLFQKSPGSAVVPAAGVFARAGFALPWRFEISLDISGLAALPTARVGVEGTSAAGGSPLYGLLSGRLGWSAW